MLNAQILLFFLIGLAVQALLFPASVKQRQNAAALLGALLLGVEQGMLGDPRMFAHGEPASIFLSVASSLLFAAGLLRRAPASRQDEQKRLIAWIGVCLLSMLNSLTNDFASLTLCFAAQVGCCAYMLFSYKGISVKGAAKGLLFIAGFFATTYFHHVEYGGFVQSEELMWAPAVLWVSTITGMLVNMITQDVMARRLNATNAPSHNHIPSVEALQPLYEARQTLKNFRHDLRQPLSTIGILASVGRAVSKDADVVMRYEHVQSAQKGLKNMLEDFFKELENHLNLSNPQAHYQPRDFLAADILNPLVEEYRFLAVGKGLQIRYQANNVRLFTNPSALGKVVRNGLDNAIKYTRSGGVVVHVREFPKYTLIQIVDTGSGIDDNKVESFNKGWGHGSTIVKTLSDKLGIETSAKNRVLMGRTRGTRFLVKIPKENEKFQQAQMLAAANTRRIEAVAFSENCLRALKDSLPQNDLPMLQYSYGQNSGLYYRALLKGPAALYLAYLCNPVDFYRVVELSRFLNSTLGKRPLLMVFVETERIVGDAVEFMPDMIRVQINTAQRENAIQEHLFELLPHLKPSEDSTEMGSKVMNINNRIKTSA